MDRLRLFAVQFELNELTTFSFVLCTFISLETIKLNTYWIWKMQTSQCMQTRNIYCDAVCHLQTSAPNSTSRPLFTNIDEYIIISNSGDDGSLYAYRALCIMSEFLPLVGASYPKQKYTVFSEDEWLRTSNHCNNVHIRIQKSKQKTKKENLKEKYLCVTFFQHFANHHNEFCLICLILSSVSYMVTLCVSVCV